MEKLDGKSMDLVKANIESLKQLFPEVVTEGKIDFEKLKLVLGEEIEKRNERYEFTWHGKTQAMKLAQTPSTGTLRPDKESSKNWDTTENLYIEGDNLEVLKLLQKSYFGKIKMIYIDPPYNTGKDFVYKDDFRDNIKNYKEMTQQTTKANTETNGRFHTDWLNMMYPRLKLARNLLTEDGWICVSISDEEYSNLKKLMDEIFGENNFRNTIFVRRHDKNLSNQFIEKGLKSLSVGLEYILVYSKTESSSLNPVFRKADDIRQKEGYWKSFWNDADRPTMRYELLGVTPESGQWKWKKEIAIEAVKNYEEYLKNYADHMSLEEYYEKNGKTQKFIRRRKDLNGKNKGVEHWVPPTDGILRTTNWSDLLITDSINNLDLKFSSPKNVKVIRELVQMCTQESDIVLDFFAGSSTTAHTIMQMNAEDGGNRKFIMVQLPELTDEKSEAYKAGYKNICEIGKERIRRAGEKIVQETGKTDLDIGFKVFKLDSSNVKPWDPDFANLEQTIFDLQDNIKEDRTKEDLLYEILLKIGLPLTTPIEEINVNGKTIYSVGFGSVLLCLEDEIDLDIVNEMMKHKSEHMTPKVIFKESGFINDSVKTNAIQTLKKNGITDVRSV
jgi:adenine-specific DNA-methyltransferase